MSKPSPCEIALTRAIASLPIESTRELVCNLNALRKRIPEHTPRWYFMNRLIRDAMDEADKEERSARIRTLQRVPR